MTDSGDRVVHNPERSRFDLLRDGAVVGWLDVRPAGERTIIDHTEVDDALEGQGLGGLLVREAITAIRAEGKEPIVLCPFARGYVQRHPDLLG